MLKARIIPVSYTHLDVYKRQHRGAAKRFNVTKNGKVKMNKAFRRHILNKKTTKRKRHLRKQAYCSKANAAVIKKLIPYK